MLILAIMAVLSAAKPSLAQGRLTLAKDGKTDYCIAIGQDAIEPERTAAKELAHYLSKVTGAEFAVKSAADVPEGTPCILVGQTDTVQKLLPDVDWKSLGCDGIVIRGVGARLVLAGGRPRGSLYAVYTFLQDIVGCRWYANDAQEIVPSKPTLSIEPPKIVYRPAFDFRQLYTQAIRSGTDPLFPVKLRQNPAGIPEELGGGVSYGGAHTMLALVPPKQYFEEHPDWYALDAGKRVPDNLCFMSDGARKAAADKVLEQLGQEYSKWKYLPKIMSVSAPDGGMHCRCEKCVAALEREGSDSGALIEFVNYVAEQVEKQYPDVLVSTLAYWNTAAPPTQAKPRKNVLVQLGISNEGYHPANKRDRVVQRNFRLPFSEVAVFNQYLDDWHKIASHLWIWDYDTNFTNMVQPHPTYFAFPNSLRFYRDLGVTGVFSQGSWSGAGDFPQMKAWVNSQMMWNPDQDVRVLMNDFLNGYYGAAAPYLMEYLELMNGMKGRLGPYENCTRGWLGLADLNKATALFTQAVAAVAADELLSFRARRARLSIDIVWLQRYRELRRAAKQQGIPFLGPEDPYAEVERIAKDEFHTHTYAEWATFDAYIAMLRKLFPVRLGHVPVECQGLKPYQWEEIQENLLVATPTDCATVVDDPKASNGRALMLKSAAPEWKASYAIPSTASGGLTTVPCNLAGRYRVYAVVRAEPAGESPATVALGISAPEEICRVTAEFSAANSGEYRTIDLGTHDLANGAKLWVQTNGTNPQGKPKAVYVDRFFLLGVE